MSNMQWCGKDRINTKKTRQVRKGENGKYIAVTGPQQFLNFNEREVQRSPALAKSKSLGWPI